MWAATRLYTIATLTGGVIMALEILSSRILAPHFGNSVYVWGSIISVFLAALSLGYAWGGRLADRRPDPAVLGRLILAAALWQTVLLAGGVRMAGLLASWVGPSPIGTLLTATALFGPPSVFLATVSPFAVRLAARDLAHVGNTTGRLYALSTAGSLAGTLLCTFILIPYLELRSILALLLMATVAAVALTVRRVARDDVLNATGAAVATLAAVLGVVAGARPPADVLYRRMTPYQTLEVRERDGVRTLRSDGVLQSAVERDDLEPGLAYLRYAPAALLLDPEPERMLVLGMGGGAVGNYLRSRIPGLAVDYVEIDPAIPEIARRFLWFQDHPLDRIHVADGRRFLAASHEIWDYIYCDTYIGLSVPFHLATLEFFEIVRARLAPGGVFGMNLAASTRDPFVRAVLRTVAERFPTVYVFSVRTTSNVLVLASASHDTLSREQMIARGRELDARWIFEPTVSALAAQRTEVEVDPAEAMLLTDDFAPANHLIRLGSSELLLREPE